MAKQRPKSRIYTIKFFPYRQELGKIYHRQTIGHQMYSRDGRYRFVIGDEPCEPDFLVVQGKGLREPGTFHVAPENTIMMATEPATVLVYPQSYIDQFGMINTCQEHTLHPHVVYGPAILPWFVGFTERDGKCSYTIDREYMELMPLPQKEKLISVITSNKAFTQGHLDRIRFVKKLKDHFGDRLDVFGRGYNTFDDKWDVLAPYRYHIAIENTSQRFYWTEKISDCYLAGAYPFYYGCTNLGDYFPSDSFTPIDLHDADAAIATIERQIAADAFSASSAALSEARQRVLNVYDLFEYTARLCDQLNPDAEKKEVTLKPCRSISNIHNLYNYTVKHNLFKLKMKLSRDKL